jgi:hypothetical protein
MIIPFTIAGPVNPVNAILVGGIIGFLDVFATPKKKWYEYFMQPSKFSVQGKIEIRKGGAMIYEVRPSDLHDLSFLEAGQTKIVGLQGQKPNCVLNTGTPYSLYCDLDINAVLELFCTTSVPSQFASATADYALGPASGLWARIVLPPCIPPAGSSTTGSGSVGIFDSGATTLPPGTFKPGE